MTRLSTATLIALSTFMLYGCGNSAPPKCDEAEVLGLVTELFHKHIRDQRKRPLWTIYPRAWDSAEVSLALAGGVQ